MTESSIVKKLLIKPGHKLLVLNAPKEFTEGLGELPGGADIVIKPTGPVDFVLLFVANRSELDKHAAAAVKAVKHDALLWIAYPKGTSKMKTDINRDSLNKAIQEQFGLTGIALVSIDDTWSAMRFRPAKKVVK